MKISEFLRQHIKATVMDQNIVDRSIDRFKVPQLSYNIRQATTYPMVRKIFQVSTFCENSKNQMLPNHQHVFSRNIYKERKSSFMYHHVIQFSFLLVVFALIGFLAWNKGNFNFLFHLIIS